MADLGCREAAFTLLDGAGLSLLAMVMAPRLPLCLLIVSLGRSRGGWIDGVGLIGSALREASMGEFRGVEVLLATDVAGLRERKHPPIGSISLESNPPIGIDHVHGLYL